VKDSEPKETWEQKLEEVVSEPEKVSQPAVIQSEVVEPAVESEQVVLVKDD
jgi:hypothetical protein